MEGLPLDRIGGGGLVAIAVLWLVLTGFRLWLDWSAKKDRAKIADAAACNVPPDVVGNLRVAIQRQESIAAAQNQSHDRLERSIDKMVLALERHAERITEALAEVRARRRS